MMQNLQIFLRTHRILDSTWKVLQKFNKRKKLVKTMRECMNVKQYGLHLVK